MEQQSTRMLTLAVVWLVLGLLTVLAVANVFGAFAYGDDFTAEEAGFVARPFTVISVGLSFLWGSIAGYAVAKFARRPR